MDDIRNCTVTDAPVDYDYGWTKPVMDQFARHRLSHRGDGMLRLVETDNIGRAESQRGRYSSGNHFVRSYEDFLLDMHRYPDSYELLDNPIHYFREVFDLDDASDWKEADADSFRKELEHLVDTKSGFSFKTHKGGLELEVQFKGQHAGFHQVVFLLNRILGIIRTP